MPFKAPVHRLRFTKGGIRKKFVRIQLSNNISLQAMRDKKNAKIIRKIYSSKKYRQYLPISYEILYTPQHGL